MSVRNPKRKKKLNKRYRSDNAHHLLVDAQSNFLRVFVAKLGSKS
jgi:hypothetical protein